MIVNIAGYCLVEESFWISSADLPPYGGYDRDPWGQQWTNKWFQEDFRVSGAPAEYREWNRDSNGIQLAGDLEWALGMRMENQEVLAVASPLVCKIKGAIPIDDSAIEWLGYEPFAEWSLIGHGIYASPDVFSEKWRERLNADGLLEEPALGQELLDDYVRLMADENLVEPMESLTLNVVRVGRLRRTVPVRHSPID